MTNKIYKEYGKKKNRRRKAAKNSFEKDCKKVGSKTRDA